VRSPRGERGPARGVVALLVLLAACKGGAGKEPEGLGRPVFTGPVRLLSASPDGAWLAFLDGCVEVKARFLPPATASCDLRVIAARGGEARKIARSVTTLPHALGWGPGGATLAALAEYEVPSAVGTLVVWRGADPRALGEGVSFHGFGAGGELGWVADGRLSVELPGEAEPRRPKGAEGVASFEISPGGAGCDRERGALRLLARRTHAAGGQLLGVGCDLREARVVEDGRIGDYGFSREGAFLGYTVREGQRAELRLAPAAGSAGARTVGKGAQGFAFAPSGSLVAFVADVVPGRQGNLHLAETGRPGRLLAPEVGEFRWAREAPLLAWLEKYDPRGRSGTLGIGGPGVPARTIAANVSDFDVSPDGKHAAFLQHSARGGYSVDLGLAHADAPPEAVPDVVARGVFGFSFSPDGRWLYYRTRCVRNAEACDLERIPSTGLAPGGIPEAIAPGVKSFEFDPRDPERLLVTWQRMDMVALDVAVFEKRRLTSIDTAVLPGSARFLGPDSRRVGYAVVHPKRQGVYVAELPR